jgi:predicted aspartyl protease
MKMKLLIIGALISGIISVLLLQKRNLLAFQALMFDASFGGKIAFVDITVNGKPVHAMVDTGASGLTLSAKDSAIIAGQKPVRTDPLQTATGILNTPIYQVQLKFADGPAFNAEATTTTGSNSLIGIKDLSVVYDIHITANGVELTPKVGGGTAPAPAPAQAPAPAASAPTDTAKPKKKKKKSSSSAAISIYNNVSNISIS